MFVNSTQGVETLLKVELTSSFSRASRLLPAFNRPSPPRHGSIRRLSPPSAMLELDEIV